MSLRTNGPLGGRSITGRSWYPALLGLLLCTLAVPAAAQPFERVVAPFPVSDAAGPLAQPFVGGFDRPRPALADFDGDGDTDLLVQERNNALTFFENTGGSLVWRTDRFGGLDAEEWARFVDYDGDGDLDAFAEQPFSLVRYFRNDSGSYVPVRDTLRTPDGNAINIDRQNLPTFGDLTCDGLKDLLVAEFDGSLTLYPALSSADGLPRFASPVHNYQGILIVGESGKAEDPKHGATNLQLADVDADGDLDVLWGDFFSPSLYLLRDDAGCPSPHFVRVTDTFPSASFLNGGYNAPTWGDLDGDGRPELVVGSVGGAFSGKDRQRFTDNLYHFAQPAPGVFDLQTKRLIRTLDVGTYSTGALGDLDGDGDLDFIAATRNDTTGGRGRLFAWENAGSPEAPRFESRALTLPEDDRFALFPALGDLSGDGRLDLLVGAFDGTVRYLRATGPFAFEKGHDEIAKVRIGTSAAPALGDLDGDGDLDLLVGEAAGYLNAYRNVGTRTQPLFFLTSEEYVTRADVKATPALADFDGDGDLDLLVGTQTGRVALYANTGTRQQAAFSAYTPLVAATPEAPLPLDTAPVPGDLDGDGDLDLLVGEASGGFLYYRNDKIRVEPPPTGGPLLLAHRTLPNPARAAVTLHVELGDMASVEACVFDLLGRRVACTNETMLGPGAHALPLDLSGAASGIYLYRLTVGGQAATGRLVRL